MSKKRLSNVELIKKHLAERNMLQWAIILHAEKIAEEALCDEITLNGMIIYSVNNRPKYIRNRRLLYRVFRRATRLKTVDKT